MFKSWTDLMLFAGQWVAIGLVLYAIGAGVVIWIT